jgi:hypothetical protein
VSRLAENKTKITKIVRLGFEPGGLAFGLGPAEKKERKIVLVHLVCVVDFVAQRVLGAHLGCLDYRVEVQKY